MEFRKHTLENGLQIIAECDGAAYSTALGYFICTGSRDENDQNSGVSHFLEHMVFKGTPTRTAEQVNIEFDEMGAHYNAYTTEESTVYYAAILPEMQTRAVELLSDIMRPSLREEDFDTEKQVIIEEIKMYDDQPPFGGYELLREKHFGDHPLGRSILGTDQSVTDLSVKAMRDYFQLRYSPSNIVLVASGKVDFDQLVATAEKAAGDWQNFETKREKPKATGCGGFYVVEKSIATQQYVLQLADGPAAEDQDRYAARLLSMILGDESGSRIYWELVETGRAEHASIGCDAAQGSGVYMIYMSCEPEAVEENLQTIHNILKQAEQEGVTAEELKQVKSKLKARIVLGSEKPRTRLFVIGSQWIDLEKYHTVRELLDRIEAVTLDEVNQVLKDYPLSQYTTVAIGPLEKVAEPK